MPELPKRFLPAQSKAVVAPVGERVHFFPYDVRQFADTSCEEGGLFKEGRTDFLIVELMKTLRIDASTYCHRAVSAGRISFVPRIDLKVTVTLVVGMSCRLRQPERKKTFRCGAVWGIIVPRCANTILMQG